MMRLTSVNSKTDELFLIHNSVVGIVCDENIPCNEELLLIFKLYSQRVKILSLTVSRTKNRYKP